MSFENLAVAEAYKLGTYTDSKGQVWQRGMDGWFFEMSKDSSLLIRHGDFIELIEKEHPDEQ